MAVGSHRWTCPPVGIGRDLRKIFDPAVSRQIWENISRRFAQNASGEVFVFLDNPSDTSIFNQVELDALKKNPKVTRINIFYRPKSPCG